MIEPAGYRETLADILDFTAGKRFLRLRDAAAYLGLSVKTVTRRYGIDGQGITATRFALKLTKGE